MKITGIAQIKGCFRHCFSWQDFPKVHSRGVHVYLWVEDEAWVVTFWFGQVTSCCRTGFCSFFWLWNSNQNITEGSPPPTPSLLTFRNTDSLKGGEFSYLIVLLYWTSSFVFKISLGMFHPFFWKQIKLTHTLCGYRYSMMIGWMIL